MANTSLQSPTMANPATGLSKKGTWSFWVKRADLGNSMLYHTYENSNNRSYIKFDSSDRIEVKELAGANTDLQLVTSRKFRDTNAWYHIVFAVDTTDATQADRAKLYVNNELITVFDTNTRNIPTNHSYHGLYGGIKQTIGNNTSPSSSEGFGGIMSYVAFIDGTQEAPTIFGETDATTGEWKIKTSITPSSAWGTNGYLILKDGNSLTDQSVNSNNFTLGNGTLTKTEDCPDNVFATLNSLDKNDVVVLGNGNTTSYSSNNGTWSAANRTTLGIASGKFYWEMKITGSGTANGLFFGVCSDTVRLITNQGIQDSSTEKAKGVLVFCDDGQYQLDTNSRTSMTSAPAFNDILGCALDRDNNNVKFYKNGSQVGSIDISSSPLATCSHIMPLMINFYTNTKFNFNFGNGYFGTTAVATQGNNASGNGIFEHDVPTGYTALSTKGLNL